MKPQFVKVHGLWKFVTFRGATPVVMYPLRTNPSAVLPVALESVQAAWSTDPRLELVTIQRAVGH